MHYGGGARVREKSQVMGALIILSVILSVLGNLLGNPVALNIPTDLAPYSLWALVLVTLAAIGSGLLLAHLQDAATSSLYSRRSHLRQLATILLIVWGGILAAVVGILSNVAAGQLPIFVKPYAIPLLLLVTTLAVGVTIFLYRVQTAPPVEATNRKNFLNRLSIRYNRWLEEAVRGSAVVEIGLREAATAVSQQVSTLQSPTEDQKQEGFDQLPTGLTIRRAFEASLGQLLILGDPGSGKTTLLVELALSLVKEARLQRQTPLPVIFNLSTWAINQRDLSEWIVEDLEDVYHVPIKVAKSWIKSNEILPLLDGLDEVPESMRGACIEAINEFHQAHLQIPLVVCSRVTEYQAQQLPLMLNQTIILEPLTDTQIYAYLTQARTSLDVLRTAVSADSELLDMLRNPLLLHLVTLTYADLTVEKIPAIGDRSIWRRQLFGDYVEKMLELEQGSIQYSRYTPQSTVHYLSWLARQLRAHNLGELSLERMQPDWLTSPRSSARYRSETIAIGTVFGGLLGTIVGWLLDNTFIQFVNTIVFFGSNLTVSSAGFGWWLADQLIWSCILLGIIWAIAFVTASEAVDTSYHKRSDIVLAWLLISGATVLFLSSRFIPSDTLAAKVAVSAFFALYLAFVGRGITSAKTRHISTVDNLTFSRRKLGDNTFFGAFMGACIAFTVGVFAIAYYGFLIGLGSALLSGLISMGFFTLTFGLNEFLSPSQISERDFQTPNEGFRRSAANGLKAVVVAGIAFGLLFGVPSAFLISPAIGLLTCLACALGMAVFIGLIFGWGANVGLWVLRQQLRRERAIPSHYTRFLDFATKHFLLLRVGGSYRFVHSLLRDFFADMESESH